MRWLIGDVKVTLVRDTKVSVPVEMIYTNSDPKVVEDNAEWLASYLNQDGSLGLSVHALILDNGKQVIMVDTCNGTHAGVDRSHNTETHPFLPDMEKAGYKPQDIDVVLCTHLHNDHVGWNTREVDGKWVPTFPNARYLFGRVEFKHWQAHPDNAASSFDDAILPVLAVGQADLVDMDHRVSDEVRLEPTPGHSPGHVSVWIESKGQRALITGDAMHHPVQFAAPHWRMFLDHDADQAVATRSQLCNDVADQNVRVFGTHFVDPSSGFVTRTGDASYRFG